MPRTKVAVTIDQRLLSQVDGLVAAHEYPNRSRAIEEALHCLRKSRARSPRLLAELGKLDPREERALAEEPLACDLAWPRY